MKLHPQIIRNVRSVVSRPDGYDFAVLALATQTQTLLRAQVCRRGDHTARDSLISLLYQSVAQRNMLWRREKDGVKTPNIGIGNVTNCRTFHLSGSALTTMIVGGLAITKCTNVLQHLVLYIDHQG